ncbi:MAG: MerR family transcriptional regulator [Bryobacteraceae bacterium]
MQTRYPIRAVAKITGISLDTLRAWERRYRAVVPQRSDRGRQYGTAEIDRLLLLNQLVKRGHAIGGIASLADPDLKILLEQQPAPAAQEAANGVRLTDAIVKAIEHYDAVAAGDELSRLAAIIHPREMVYQVVIPLMREVGERWHTGAMAVAQEHMTSHLLRNMLGSMMRLYRSPTRAARMVVATPQGEPHEFGILAASMLASMAGIEPVYIGADLPAEEIAETARRVNARTVLLGITLITESTIVDVRKIADSLAEHGEVWIGGLNVASIDTTPLGDRILALKDLPAFEEECRRLQT